MLRRWQLFLITLSLGLGFGTARYLTTRPFFRSSCVSQLMQREKDPIDLQITNGSFETGRDIAARGETGSLMLPARVDLYTQLLRSDAVLTTIGERFASRIGLRDDLSPTGIVQAVRETMKVTGTEEGMITVEATAPDPHVAADLANALAKAMIEAAKSAENRLLNEHVVHLASEIERTRLALLQRERDLEEFVSRHGIVDLERQTGDVLTLVRETELIRLGLVQQRLERLQAFNEKDHVARGLQDRIERCDAELVTLRARAGGAVDGQPGDSVEKIELRLSALRGDVKRVRDWLATLESQRELFEYRLRQPTPAVSILNPAIAILQRAGPGKSNTIGASLLIAFVLGVILALLREQLDKVDDDPYLAGRADEIRAHARMLAPTWVARRIGRRAPPRPVDAEIAR